MSEQFDVYEVGERKIYKFFDGEKLVKADPMVFWRRLMEVRGDLAAHSAVAYAPFDLKDKPQALAKLAEMSRNVFGVKCLEEGGLTEDESINLLNHFWRYCETLKKNSSPSPTSSDATSETPPTTSPISESA